MGRASVWRSHRWWRVRAGGAAVALLALGATGATTAAASTAAADSAHAAGLTKLAALGATGARTVTGSAGLVYSVVPSPNAFSGNNALHGVSASSATDAWAVGSLCCQTSRFGLGTLTEHWNGAAWSIVPSPDQFRRDDVLSGVTDLSAANAWAVGFSRQISFKSRSPLIVHWDGSTWQQVTAPPGLTGTLLSVSADSPRDVWAVGDDGHGHAVALRYDGTAWSSVALPAAGAFDSLQGVKAFSPANVWAVGDQVSSGVSPVGHTLVLHWDGAAWSVVPSPNPDPNSNSLHAIDGVSSNDLWAVGQQAQDETVTGVPPGTRTLTEHWNGTTWSAVSSPNVGDQDTLNGVAAISPASVTAAGTFENRSGPIPIDRTLAQQWNGASWVTRPTPNVGSTDNLIDGAAAVPGTSTVWAVGFRLTGNGPYQTLILRGAG